MQHDNIALARKWFEQVWAPGGETVAREMLHPQALGHMESGEVKGCDQFLAVREQLLQAMPDLSIRVDDIIGEGDKVVVRWSVTATHAGDGMGLTASQQPVSFRGITWLHFSNGQLVEGWDAWNEGQLMNKLSRPGASPVAAAAA